jgi:hypothetical protein
VSQTWIVDIEGGSRTLHHDFESALLAFLESTKWNEAVKLIWSA